MVDVDTVCVGGVIFFTVLLFISLANNKPTNKRFISERKYPEETIVLTLYIEDKEIWAVYITKCLNNPSAGWLIIEEDNSHEWFPTKELAIQEANRILNNVYQLTYPRPKKRGLFF